MLGNIYFYTPVWLFVFLLLYLCSYFVYICTLLRITFVRIYSLSFHLQCSGSCSSICLSVWYLFIYLLVCFLFFILHRTGPLEWAYMALVYSKFTSFILRLYYLEWCLLFLKLSSWKTSSLANLVWDRRIAAVSILSWKRKALVCFNP